jgi:hypothetical protein
MVIPGHRVAILLPLLLAFSAGLSYGDVAQFGWNHITVDPSFTSSVIAPFTAPNPPYIPGGYFPDGFPIGNIFGAQEQTAEGTFDTIFQDGGVDYRNVFFHLDALNTVNIVQLVVDGAQDGPSNPYRSFTYFDLISYTFANITDPGTYHYTLLYHGAPTTDGNGHENITADVNLQNVGPYFVYQFGTNPSTGNSGPRVFDVVVTTPEPSAFLAFLPFGVLGGCALGRRLRRRRG